MERYYSHLALCMYVRNSMAPPIYPASNAGLLFPWEEENLVGEDLTVVVQNWKYVNTNPFFARLAMKQVGQVEFHTMGRNQRPDTATLAARGRRR
jgi:hypothetical protein